MENYEEFILIEGARQNNLKGFDLKLPLKKLIVVTGVSGSGKSSLAFDTIYAEGQRRYVETFSSYARQFLDRMDRPKVDKIEGIPPAIAIDQTNPVRTSRSTVGTMTEINDHLKLLFARTAALFCEKCDTPVTRDTPDTIVEKLCGLKEKNFPAIITFRVAVPKNFTRDEIRSLLSGQGYTRILREDRDAIEVIQDRIVVAAENRGRIVEDLEAALKHGAGAVSIHRVNDAAKILETHRFSSGLHCPDCDIHYKDPSPGLFSFNSPIGACETCRGFGRVIGVDFDLVIPDQGKTLRGGAIKPWQTASYRECQDELVSFASKRKIPLDVPWNRLTEAQRQWVLEGEGRWEDGVWYGVKRFFAWLETKAYKMHIRVLLSRYRAYRICPSCGGARLKPEALRWRVDGLSLHDIALLPLDGCLSFFKKLAEASGVTEAGGIILKEVLTRLRYLVDVGLGYLTLDRQSRTLSGGEVQRINLTTALGTSLVNSLFVLDEPSIGLHSRDIGRLIGVLHRLRDAGNTLIVVEHDPEVIRAADYVIDMGPGPGERGGRIVCFDDLRGLMKSAESVTARYLRAKRKIADFPQAESAGAGPCITIKGAGEHNLRNVDVAIPLNRMVCLTGVSGSGKSTLLRDVCYLGLKKLMGKFSESPGRHEAIIGSELLDDVVMVDQSPIGRTTRSNPASYVGAFDAIRKAFADSPEARKRGYTAGTFSFNSGRGRCPTCGGNGYEHVEMQFLSDVYLRCPDCDGKRFRPEILDITVTGATGGAQKGKSIAEILEMTVDEACAFFNDSPAIKRALEPLTAVGLSYMRLGQPLPTLSGGEAQRLKLAGYLVENASAAKNGKGSLFMFDEPTTGLHFADIEVLMKAFRSLIEKGHSVVVIEHNLDVILGADWIIDLGPEGGNAGGGLVCAGTPLTVMRCRESRTGRALSQYESFDADAGRLHAPKPEYRGAAPASIVIKKAREHNLRDLDLSIPRNAFSVITGVSGSGKSTVAFDIVFAEGQRRYLESLNAYSRQFVQPAARPDVDGVFGIPPTVAIEQRTSRGGRKSTVATVTEIYHFLRLLYVKLGVQHCPDCAIPIAPRSAEGILAEVMRDYRGRRISLRAPLVMNRKGYYTDLAKWAHSKGYDTLIVDGKPQPTENWPRLDRYKEHTIELPVGTFDVDARREADIHKTIDTALAYGKGVLSVTEALKKKAVSVIFSTLRACPRCSRSFEEPDPRLLSFNSKHGWCPHCFGTGLAMSGFDETQTGEEIWWNEWWGGEARTCGHCKGGRLRPEALSILLEGKSISDLTGLSVAKAQEEIARLDFGARKKEIAEDIVAELVSRLAFLKQVGLGYIALDRSAPTLSGGEAQRIRLAAQLGSNLRGVCYVLDEPTIGLHPSDNRKLLDTLLSLKNKGNTIVVVEHDEETIRSADYLLDLGPGGGKLGGNLIAAGTPEQVLDNPRSLTGAFLKKPLSHQGASRPVTGATRRIFVRSAHLHNLKHIDVAIPLGRLVCVTGVSGSGKSTLVRDVIHDNILRIFSRKKRPGDAFHGCDDIGGLETIDKILEVDQTPIGKTPRSCPATYIGIWDEIRKIFSRTQEAMIRGFTASRFSFNTSEGRCGVCEGQGMKKIEMNFLPDVTTLCEACGGARFTQETLEVKFKDKTVAEVLAMSIDEAAPFFGAHHRIHRALLLLQETGLGYLSLGQQSPTLSGGEAQRIKLVTELRKSTGARPPRTIKADPAAGKKALYILDEPTVGLHMADVEKLLHVLHKLVDDGNTIVVIEHNLDVIAEADWIIDLGPEGGDKGGTIVTQGTPADIAKAKGSKTGKFLKEFYRTHERRQP